MTTVRFRHDIGDLADDLTKIAVTAKTEMAKVVAKTMPKAVSVMQGIAKTSAGPHGKNYYKRIDGDLLSPLVAEIGPHGDVDGNAVGAGWRHGQNTDAPRTADVMGPALESAAGKLLDGFFWPGA